MQSGVVVVVVVIIMHAPHWMLRANTLRCRFHVAFGIKDFLVIFLLLLIIMQAGSWMHPQHTYGNVISSIMMTHPNIMCVEHSAHNAMNISCRCEIYIYIYI